MSFYQKIVFSFKEMGPDEYEEMEEEGGGGGAAMAIRQTWMNLMRKGAGES